MQTSCRVRTDMRQCVNPERIPIPQQRDVL
jgi:hypothetical protein